MLLLRTIQLLPKHKRALIFSGTGYGEPYFSTYLFKCLFEERALKVFLCCTISSTPGGHPALRLNICKLLTKRPMLPFFTFYIWSIDSLYNMTSILSSHFTRLSRTVLPIPLYSWLPSPKVTLPTCHSFRPCGRQVSPLRRLSLGYFSKYFNLPR